MGLKDIGMSLPPGFKFYPSDEELVCHYLQKKIDNEELVKGTLVQIDLHTCEPWQLPEVAKLNANEWYFFSFRDRKYATGFRTNRATTSGYWKATGKDRIVLHPKTRVIVGMRKTLVFYKNRAPNGIKTGWIMHEFRLENPHMPPKEDWVLCRVFHKSREENTTYNIDSPPPHNNVVLDHQLILNINGGNGNGNGNGNGSTCSPTLPSSPPPPPPPPPCLPQELLHLHPPNNNSTTIAMLHMQASSSAANSFSSNTSSTQISHIVNNQNQQQIMSCPENNNNYLGLSSSPTAGFLQFLKDQSINYDSSPFINFKTSSSTTGDDHEDYDHESLWDINLVDYCSWGDIGASHHHHNHHHHHSTHAHGLHDLRDHMEFEDDNGIVLL
ncbi:hypothetical protein Dimus_016786 [Dionaea muscipula]